MKRVLAVLAVLAPAVALGADVRCTDEVSVVCGEKASLSIDGRLQMLGFAQYLDDLARSDARLYLFMKQARFGASGHYDAVEYKLSMALGGEEEVRAPSPGMSLSLLDLYVDVPLPRGSATSIRAGQFKVPYGRERLTDSADLLFADRSIQNLSFRLGRDVGATVQTSVGNVRAAAGVFTGGGRDVPERYLPQRLGIPLLVVRAGYDTGTGENAYGEAKARPDRPGIAVYGNGLFIKDSQVGHGTVLSVRTAEKSLLVNSNWNPYIVQAPTSLGTLWQTSLDVAARFPMPSGTLTGEAEAHYGKFDNAHGSIALWGARAQLAYAWNGAAVAMRYAVLFPDEKLAVGEVPITGSQPIQEFTPSVSFWLYEGLLKLVVDMPILVNVPVVQENGIGAYVLTEQPDQTSYLKTAGNAVERQKVFEGRVLLQAAF